MKSEAIHLPHIGMRIIKSALGVLLCFVIYLIRGKQGTPFYSALAVLWCIQNQTRNTFGNALQRTIGTGIGALYGLVYILAKMGLPDVGDGILHYLLISVTLIPIIYSTVVIQQKKASYFSCVVFLKGYSYIKIYNKNASVKNMIDYIKNQAGTSGVVTFSDSKRDSAAFHYPECNQIIRKVHHMFYWGRG